MPVKKNSGLGRGLDAIFLENTLDKESENNENKINMLKISLVDPKSDQPRKNFDKDALEELADSIAQNGVLQPILVREYGSGRYQIIAGERRFRASKIAGLNEIPAIILDKDDRKAAEIALIENIQREDLNPVEEALGYGALIEKFGLTQEQVAKQVGRSRSAVANMLRLLELPDEVLEMLKSGELSAGHAKALLGLEDEEKIEPLAQRIIERGMSVREVEAAVKKANETKFEEEEEKVHPQIRVYMKELERKAMSSLGRKVRISRSSKKKIVELSYSDDEDLEALLKALCGNDIFAENN